VSKLAYDLFGGTDRFVVEQRLGSGGFGIVYRAHDRQRLSTVAIKTLYEADPQALYRFKQEFRALAGVSHPNLVELYELFAEGSVWFFTMEMVDGQDFQSYVRPDVYEAASGGVADPNTTRIRRSQPGRADPPTLPAVTVREPEPVRLDVERLRRALPQLAEGVRAVHRAGRLHRDLKPSNVLVTPEGRVVILDFGLVTELRSSSPDAEQAGSPAYMSPEQVRGTPVGAASDWYSVGVMLYQALTGRLPFVGPLPAIMMARLVSEPPPPESIDPSVPPDLAALCRALLKIDPAERPSGDAICAALQGEDVPSLTTAPVDAPEVFVGRERELEALREAARSTARDRPVVVAVRGDSGIGKSALCRAFLDECSEAGALVLRSRCYAQESLPFKALDGLVDSLASHLLRLSTKEVARLKPPHVDALLRLFPTLGRVTAFGTPTSSDDVDPQELRRRAFEALRHLLATLGETRSLVLFIDDVHFGDEDSAAALASVVRGPGAPRFLLVVTGWTAPPAIAKLDALFAALESRGLPHRTLELSELDATHAAALLRATFARDGRDEPAELDVEGLLREASGHPLYLEALARHSMLPTERDDEDAPSRSLRLLEVLERQIRSTPELTQRLLSVLALAGRPLPERVVCQAAGLPSIDPAALRRLRALRLAREQHMEGEALLEIYHGKVAEAAAGMLEAERRRSVHGELARTLEEQQHDEAELIASHWDAAGEPERARPHLQRAAEEAARTLAFEHAARLYADLVGRTPNGSPELARLHVAHGEVLENAGRGGEAAQAYLRAVPLVPQAEADSLEQRAAAQFLFAGYLDEGHAVLKRLVRRLDLPHPESTATKLAAFLARRARIRLRGWSWQPRDASTIDPRALERVDRLMAIGTALSMTDNLAAAVYYSEGLRLALDAGEPSRVAVAYSVEIPFSAVGGIDSVERTRQLVERGFEIAKRVDRPDVIGQMHVSAGAAAVFQGRWRDAVPHLDEADALLRAHGRGFAWHRDTAHAFGLEALANLGEVEAYRERFPRYLDDARARGDRYAETLLCVARGAFHHLTRDEPAQARELAKQGIARWPLRGFDAFHAFALDAEVQAALYEAPERAWAVLEPRWSTMKRGLMQHAQLVRVKILELGGRTAIAALLAGAPAARALRGAARSSESALRKEKGWAVPLADLLAAGLAEVDGGDPTRSLRAAIDGFRHYDMALHALAAERALGDTSRIDEALRARGVRDPVRYSRMLIPRRG
jgi:hypothetical protein